MGTQRGQSVGVIKHEMLCEQIIITYHLLGVEAVSLLSDIQNSICDVLGQFPLSEFVLKCQF